MITHHSNLTNAIYIMIPMMLDTVIQISFQFSTTPNVPKGDHIISNKLVFEDK